MKEVKKYTIIRKKLHTNLQKDKIEKNVKIVITKKIEVRNLTGIKLFTEQEW